MSAAQAGQPALDILLFFNTASDGSTTVSGTFTGGSLSGSISGTLSASGMSSVAQSIPVPSGTFQGVLTAGVGCNVAKNYSGPLTPSSLQWTAGSDVSTCAGQTPLTFNISATAAGANNQPSPSASGTYVGDFSVATPLADPIGGCARTFTTNATMTIAVTVASDGTVSGTAHAVGQEVLTSVVQTKPNTPACDTSPVGNSVGSESAINALAGTFDDFAYKETEIVALAQGNATHQWQFNGVLSGSTITAVLSHTVTLDVCNAFVAVSCTGTGSTTFTLTKR